MSHGSTRAAFDAICESLVAIKGPLSTLISDEFCDKFLPGAAKQHSSAGVEASSINISNSGTGVRQVGASSLQFRCMSATGCRIYPATQAHECDRLVHLPCNSGAGVGGRSGLNAKCGR